MSEYSTAGLTIRDLRRIMASAEVTRLSDDAVIVIAKDAEGNAYSPAAAWDVDPVYVPECSYAGALEYWDEDDVEDAGPDREDYESWRVGALAEGGLPCLVLWPTN